MSHRVRAVLFRAAVVLVFGLLVFIVLYTTTNSKFGSIMPPSPDGNHFGQMKDVKLSPEYAESIRITEADTPGHVNMTIQERFTQRHSLLEDGCKRFRRTRGSSRRVYRGDFISVPEDVFYCGIEKVASTEWKNLFQDMSEHHMTGYALHDWPGALNGSVNPYKAAKTRFIFVREPYGRLLSAYVDKLFSPNVIFWKMLGRLIVKRFRPQPTKLSLQCGHDVTFAEFIDYVLHVETSGMRGDGHFTPQFKHCHICDFPYTYVGHLETLTADRDFLLKVMQSPVKPRPNFAVSNLRSQVSWYIKDYERYKDCMTKDEALRRLWQKLKIRGHLHSSFEFPLTPQQSENVTVQSFLDIARVVVTASLNISASSVKANKRRALREAFDTVPLSKKQLLAKLFHWDFELFGYDPYPEDVFGSAFQSEKE